MNEAGFDADNEGFCEGRDLPWLQDTQDVGVWSAWQVTYRDVIVLDRQGLLVGAFNLTENDLADADSLDQLRAALLRLAEEAPAR